MCGIFGLQSNREIGPAQRERVARLHAGIRHRGPDGRGEWTRSGLLFGHARLAILDLSPTGAQPMTCLDGRYTLVFNGEIYNFVELAAELTKFGYAFRSSSDTEVIAAAYDRWGGGCFSKFNGMWAIALWDERRAELVLSRDRFGVKPLYYTEAVSRDGAEEFAFASEVKALHRWLGDRAEIDARVVRGIAAGDRSHHGTPATYLKNVSAIPAGHWAVRGELGWSLRRWYDLSESEAPRRFEDAVERFRELLVDACRIRLRSDVPVATCLSGGLDSGSILAVIRRRLQSDFGHDRVTADFHQAFTLAFEGTSLDESTRAERIARELGASFHRIPLREPTPERILAAMAECDGPMPNPAFFPISELYRAIRANSVKVTLDGMGPDELLGGYLVGQSAYRSAFRRADLARVADLHRTFSRMGEFEFYSARAQSLREMKAGLFRAPVPSFFIERRRNAREAREDPRYRFSHPLSPRRTGLSRSLEVMFFQNTLPMLLQQYDRCAMAHGVESRFPFLDYRIVEFGFSIPDEWKVGGGFTKRILREAVKGLLPEAARAATLKQGFHPPEVDWWKGAVGAIAEPIFRERAFLESPYFDGKDITARFARWKESPLSPASWGEVSRFWGPLHVHAWATGRLD